MKVRLFSKNFVGNPVGRAVNSQLTAGTGAPRVPGVTGTVPKVITPKAFIKENPNISMSGSRRMLHTRVQHPSVMGMPSTKTAKPIGGVKK